VVAHHTRYHTTATHCCNTELRHSTVTHYCNTLLQHITATHYCNILLSHTTVPTDNTLNVLIVSKGCDASGFWEQVRHWQYYCIPKLNQNPKPHGDKCKGSKFIKKWRYFLGLKKSLLFTLVTRPHSEDSAAVDDFLRASLASARRLWSSAVPWSSTGAQSYHAPTRRKPLRVDPKKGK